MTPPLTSKISKDAYLHIKPDYNNQNNNDKTVITIDGILT